MPRCAYYLTCLVLVGARTRADLDLALSEWQRTGSAGPNTWQVAGISNLSGLFRGLSDFNEDISGWDTSAALDMSYMFYGCASFDQPLNSWNTSSVRDMSFMFAGASRFNQPIGSWNTSSVSRMQGMFSGAGRFNQELNGWETQAVVNMSHMFYEATSFDQALGKWNTSKVIDMKYMFFDAHEFKQPLSTWDFRAVDAPFLDRKFSAMNPCLLWSAANAHSLPEDLRKLWSLMRCPSCPAGSCSKGQACVAGQCRPVNSGFIELGLGAWPSQLPVAVQGFKACAEACSRVKCVGFLLEESGRCGLITQLERGGEGRTAAFLRATCDTFSCPYGSQRRASDEELSAFNCCACNGQTVPDLEQYPLLHCLECPEDMVPVEDLCEECAFPFMHLNKTCTLWYWPIILMLLLLLAGVALRMGRWRRQKRQKEAQKLWEAMEQDLWDGACDVRRYTMPLARCGWSKAAVWQRLLELKAEQSRCAGVSLLYVLTDFTSLARARLADRDASFQALLEAFFRGKDPIGRHLRCPRDGRQGCALVDWLEPWHRRPSTHYASYANGMRLSELQAALESWKRGVEEEVFLCMHFFVQNHFRAPNLELSGLGCGHMVVVLNTWHRPSYLHRAWCLYELYSATSLSIPVSYALPLGMQQSLEAELAQGDQGLQRVTSELRGPRNEVEVDEGVEKLWAEVSHEGVKNEVQRAIGLWISRLLQQKFQRLLGQVSDCVNI